MATTRKNNTNLNKEDKENVNDISQSNQELENLRLENKKLQEDFIKIQNQMSELLNQFSIMSQFKSNIQADTAPKDIEVISLISGKLVLTTTGKSDGRHYEFNNQFDSLLIPENDLKLIIKAMPRSTENGLFFIKDITFINKNGLSGVYRNIISKDKIEDFFSKPAEESMAIYRKANKAQKELLEAMVVDKCLNSEKIDANILMLLSRETNKDFLNIQPLLKEE